jgi:hypothetical protein
MHCDEWQRQFHHLLINLYGLTYTEITRSPRPQVDAMAARGTDPAIAQILAKTPCLDPPRPGGRTEFLTYQA